MDRLILNYYDGFNERRLADVAHLFAPGAIVETPFALTARGRHPFLQFVELWLAAFPDAQLHISHVDQLSETACEVNVLATGTHIGTLDLGPCGQFQPSGNRVRLFFQDLFQTHNGKIIYANLSVDTDHIVEALNGTCQ